MKKQDLKDGDECTLRIGSIVTNGDGFKLEFQNGNHPLSLRFYNDDLTIQNDVAELDIMKVIRNGVVIFDREQQERQAKMQSDHESRAAEYKAKKDAGNYAFDSEKAYTTEEIEKKINGFAYEKIQFDFNKFKNWFNEEMNRKCEEEIYTELKPIDTISLLAMLPESVQLVIVNAMSDEQKTSLIGK